MSRHKRKQLYLHRQTDQMSPPADLPLDLPTGPLTDQEAEKYLGPLGRQARDHWRRHQPERFRQLAEKGHLNLALLHAENNHLRGIQRLMEAGHNHQEALEIVNPMFLFPPEEAEETSDLFQAARLPGGRGSFMPTPGGRGSFMPTPTQPAPATT